jgi:hypothetical protein
MYPATLRTVSATNALPIRESPYDGGWSVQASKHSSDLQVGALAKRVPRHKDLYVQSIPRSRCCETAH